MTLQEIYKINFEAEWFDVVLAPEGLAGIIKLLEEKPDIILLDIMMPNTDGFEVLRIINKQSSIKTPIIVCSNLSSEDDMKKAFELWAVGYIRKSDYEWEEIVQKTIETLNKQNSEDVNNK